MIKMLELKVSRRAGTKSRSAAPNPVFHWAVPEEDPSPSCAIIAPVSHCGPGSGPELFLQMQSQSFAACKYGKLRPTSGWSTACSTLPWELAF